MLFTKHFHRFKRKKRKNMWTIKKSFLTWKQHLLQKTFYKYMCYFLKKSFSSTLKVIYLFIYFSQNLLLDPLSWTQRFSISMNFYVIRLLIHIYYLLLSFLSNQLLISGTVQSLSLSKKTLYRNLPFWQVHSIKEKIKQSFCLCYFVSHSTVAKHKNFYCLGKFVLLK